MFVFLPWLMWISWIRTARVPAREWWGLFAENKKGRSVSLKRTPLSRLSLSPQPLLLSSLRQTKLLPCLLSTFSATSSLWKWLSLCWWDRSKRYSLPWDRWSYLNLLNCNTHTRGELVKLPLRLRQVLDTSDLPWNQNEKTGKCTPYVLAWF